MNKADGGSEGGRIPHQSDLSPSAIPAPDAEYGELADFALSFDGYAFAGGFEELSQLHDQVVSGYRDSGRWEASLPELRAALFFQQRIIRHQEHPGNAPWGPDHPAGRLLRELVDAVRTRTG